MRICEPGLILVETKERPCNTINEMIP